MVQKCKLAYGLWKSGNQSTDYGVQITEDGGEWRQCKGANRLEACGKVES